MWLKLTNGREELIVNTDHIKRLISEGAVEIPDPRVTPEVEENATDPALPVVTKDPAPTAEP